MRTNRIAALAFGLASLAGAASAQPPGDAAKGANVYEDRCSGCHVLQGMGEGPPLAGVVGRKAGSVAGFPYTDAMKASGLTWTAANLDRFLTGPGKLVPGTAMQITLPADADRRNLIAYLSSLKR
ncbi:MAG TPA: c-type cytochrome [Caulobacteraceae bacterium]|jgi:cytochrome c